MIGQKISHYKILEKLDEGGMGVVYKAEDTTLKRQVALKFLPKYLMQNPEAQKRFVKEAQAAAALNHPNICTIYEIDKIDKQSFISMEYLDGQTLQKKIKTGPMNLDNTTKIAIQVAHGLSEAHDKGIIHRDIKSANIMVTLKGDAKIMDFGLARFLAVATKLTKEGTTLGTAGYMSPEQTTGNKVDRRTDIWSLGIVIYEMLTGVLPFRADYEAAIIYSILHEQPEPATVLRPEIPTEFNQILQKALAKEPDERYQHVDDMLVELRSLQRKLEAGATKEKEKLVPSIAVLPFVNMNRDEENEFFSDGITEDIITSLAKLEGLRV
ncbi:MAG: protein kinase, partial [Phycisphaerae bacterium]|nr:protein kinase [candidate division KSB1 bacterium]NIV01328.1 protein kinase [Phycisphaerae bacterium]NIR71916.1 protein kinase [candidate division KSB1 bacterium]NIS28007.1 protein kinase [candidate division KSB1 bacterium]NIT74877.1 protein kinase [candidate division KSB1 bacterium]